jgi:hypothetical protein
MAKDGLDREASPFTNANEGRRQRRPSSLLAARDARCLGIGSERSRCFRSSPSLTSDPAGPAAALLAIVDEMKVITGGEARRSSSSRRRLPIAQTLLIALATTKVSPIPTFNRFASTHLL